MEALVESLIELSNTDLEKVEKRLFDFDRSWTPDSLEKQRSALPEGGSQLRRATLTELIKVDMERRWSTNEQQSVEDYLTQFPELSQHETVIPQLIRTEIDIRRQCGATVEQDEIARRFPDQLLTLSDLFEQSGTLPSADSKFSASRETVRPAGNAESAAETPADKADEIPEEFGRYRVIRRVGEGAMGVVYLAKDTQLQRNVALKTPTFSGVGAAELVQRFYHEARSSATLRHANICPVHDVGEIDGRHYISMAFIEGRTLTRFIRSGKQLPQRTVAALIRKLSRALSHAHDEGVIHRDLKPGNVMIDRQNEPIIMDFGLARRIDQSDQSRVTQEGMILGTPAYMSPEQVSGSLDATGPHSDIYSLGVMCYELLTGEIPFGGPVMAVLAQIMTQEPAKPSALRPDLDPQLESICLKMMAKKREDRYKSMNEVSAALAAFLKGKTVPSPVGNQRATKNVPAPAETGQHPSVSATMVGDGEMQALAEMFAAQSVEEFPAAARAQRRPSRSTRVSKKMWVGLSIAAVSLIVLMGIVISLETDQGSIRVKVPGSVKDANIRVVIDKTEYKIGRGGATIKLEPGQHNVTIFRDGKHVGSQTLLVVTGQVNAISVPAPPREDPPPPPPLTNSDREVAQWLYDSGSYIKVRTDDGRLLSLYKGRKKRGYAKDLPESRLVITYISYRGAAATDDNMKKLRDLTSLETLHLWKVAVTERGLEHVKHLPRLKTLDLSRSKVSDDGNRVVGEMRQLKTLVTNGLIGNSGLAHLSGMDGLTSLTIYSKLITDAGLEHLSSLKNLETLNILNASITGAGLVHLSKMSKLRTLSLAETAIGDAGLVHLETLSSLRVLYLQGTNVTDAGMHSVGKLTGLESLNLANTVVGDAGAEHLGNLLRLESLDLTGTRLGNEGLRHLSECRKIKNLYLNSTRIDDAGLAYLRNIPGLIRLRVANTEITGAGIEPLTKLPRLYRLTLGGGKFTDKAAALKSLKQMYGLARLSLPGVTLTPGEFKELKTALGRRCRILSVEIPEKEEDPGGIDPELADPDTDSNEKKVRGRRSGLGGGRGKRGVKSKTEEEGGAVKETTDDVPEN